MKMQEELYPMDIEDFGDEEEVCPECLGEGFIVTCCDDICNGLGYCMHGDGEEICPRCEGEGFL